MRMRVCILESELGRRALHSRRSYSLSRAAFAWPIAEEVNVHRSFLD